MNFYFCRISILLFVVFLGNMLLAQNSSQSDELQLKLNQATISFPQEKLYLHLDRSSYYANENVWFKAYLLNSPEVENNLHVELISSDGKVILKALYLAMNGLAYGDFHLPDTLSTGMYQVRAYTNWMRNFDECWFFRKDVVVWNVRDKRKSFEQAPPPEEDFVVTFFPEGGTLLAGVDSKLAFKAMDAKGKGIDVAGVVLGENGEEILSFESDFKGMGSFVFEPKDENQYVARVSFNGVVNEFLLPQAKESGVSIEVSDETESELTIKITNKGFLAKDTELTLLAQTRGFVVFNETVSMPKEVVEIQLRKDKLPTGVLQITLFGNNMLPLCERLAFINHNDFVEVDIEVQEESSSRDKVTVGLLVETKEAEPRISSLSLSAFMKDSQLDIEKFPNNILTHFLLNSDLKGKIEEPAYYFKDQSEETKKALDNLMLTQGWRRFVWADVVADNYPEINFYHEKGINIEGRVGTLFREKPMANAEIVISYISKDNKAQRQYSDSLGRFRFDEQYFYDEATVLVRGRTPKGRKNLWIELVDNEKKAKVDHFLPSFYQYRNTTVETEVYFSESKNAFIERSWRLGDSILLGDINIVGKIKGNNILAQTPYVDVDFTMDFQKELQNYPVRDWMELLDWVHPNALSGAMRTNRTYYVDGVYCHDFVPDITPEAILTVEIARDVITQDGFGTVIYLTTRKGYHEDIYSRGTFPFTVKGYSVIRQFYMPKYEDDETITAADNRNTLFWHPNVWTDSTGKAQVSYYNADQLGDVQIVVEGITTDGKLCRGTADYKVSY